MFGTSILSLALLSVTAAASSTHLGCMYDSKTNRALPSKNTMPSGVNGPVACESFCSAQGYTVFGLQYTNECWCGGDEDDFMRNGEAPSGDCNKNCPDGSGAQCGSSNRFNAYIIDSDPQPTPAPTPAPTPTPAPEGDVVHLGCMYDNRRARALSAKFTLSFGTNGPTACEAYCLAQNNGYIYFGLQYTNECWCGKSSDDPFRNGPAPSGDCNKNCPDGSGAQCGSSNRFNAYSMPGGSSTAPAPAPASEDVETTGLASCFTLENPTVSSVDFVLNMDPVLNDFYYGGTCQSIVHADSVKLNGVCHAADNHEDNASLRNSCSSQYGGVAYKKCYWNEDTVIEVFNLDVDSIGSTAVVEFFDQSGCRTSLGSATVTVQG